MGGGAGESPGEVRPIPFPGAPEVAIPAQVDQQRFGAVEVVGVDQHRQLVARPPRRRGVEIERIAQAGGFARDRGKRADAGGQALDLRGPLEGRAGPRGLEVAPFGQLPAGRPQPVHRTVGVGVAGDRPARAPQRPPHALGHLLERGLKPRRERLVVPAPCLIFREHGEQRIHAGLDRMLLEQIGAESVDGADLRFFQAA